jgi:hypothetical protein
VYLKLPRSGVEFGVGSPANYCATAYLVQFTISSPQDSPPVH